jgi:hypothetical protein
MADRIETAQYWHGDHCFVATERAMLALMIGSGSGHRVTPAIGDGTGCPGAPHPVVTGSPTLPLSLSIGARSPGV